MVISITLTYRMALLERVAKGAFMRTLSGLCVGIPRDFHANPLLPNGLAHSSHAHMNHRKRAEIRSRRKTTFEEFVLVSQNEFATWARAVHRKRLFLFFLFYFVDIADRKGKLNSPAAIAAEILSFASEHIYNVARGTFARSADDRLGIAREETRVKKKGEKKMQT